MINTTEILFSTMSFQYRIYVPSITPHCFTNDCISLRR